MARLTKQISPIIYSKAKQIISGRTHNRHITENISKSKQIIFWRDSPAGYHRREYFPIQTNYILARLTNRISPKRYFKAKQNGAFHGEICRHSMGHFTGGGQNHSIGHFTGDGQNNRVAHFTGEGQITGSRISREMAKQEGRKPQGRAFHGRWPNHRAAHFTGDGQITAWGHFRSHFTGSGVISQDGASFHRMRRHFTGCGDFTGCGFI